METAFIKRFPSMFIIFIFPIKCFLKAGIRRTFHPCCRTRHFHSLTLMIYFPAADYFYLNALIIHKGKFCTNRNLQHIETEISAAHLI